MKATLRSINAVIAQHNVQLVKGHYYFYLVGVGMNGAYSTSIFTPYLSDQSLEAWVQDCIDLVEQAKKDRGED